MINIYRLAYELVTTKTNREMTEEETNLVGLATTFVTNELPKAFPEYDTKPISKGLLLVAKIIEGGK